MIRFRSRVARRPVEPPAGAVLAEAMGLGLRLAERQVLREVDLTVRAGEVLALVGPNGAGKSTLLAALAADLAPSTGALLIDGRPAADWTSRELALRRAVLPQTAVLSFPFTVTEVVRMGRAPWVGTEAEDEDEEAIAEAMAVTEVLPFANRPFAALSGGERARVALARVLAQRTALLLLDEPTAALDLRHQEQVLRICRERAAAGRGVVGRPARPGPGRRLGRPRRRAAQRAAGRQRHPDEVFTEELLTEVYQHPVRVLPDPDTAAPLIVPQRPAFRGRSAHD